MRRSADEPLETLRRKVRRSIAQGTPIPDGLLPDDLLLETLADIVAQNVRRQRRTRIVWILLAALLLPVMVVGCPVPGLGLMAVFFLVVFLAIALVAMGPAYGTLVALNKIEDLLPRATPDEAPSLLALDQAAHALAVPETSDARTALLSALQRLLPRFHAVDALEPIHRRALRRLALHHHRTRPDLAVVALLLLAECGDRSLYRSARSWRRRHPEEKVSAAADEYLAVVERKP